MSKIENAISELYRIDDLANRDQWVNNIHPLVKFVLTILYIVVTVSFPKYDMIGTAGMVLYLIPMFILSELSWKEAVKRLMPVLPFVCIVGIANPFFDRIPVVLLGIPMTSGVLSMLTLMMKGFFAVMASYILVATTTIEKICYALRLLHVPKIMVTQIMLTYRYITVLMKEVSRITQAYALRAPGQNGVHFKAWGSLTGQLLLRSIDRANTVYESMTIRGYQGEFRYVGSHTRLKTGDILFLAVWAAVIVLLRYFPIFLLV